jgi:hypothetical protein
MARGNPSEGRRIGVEAVHLVCSQLVFLEELDWDQTALCRVPVLVAEAGRCERGSPAAADWPAEPARMPGSPCRGLVAGATTTPSGARYRGPRTALVVQLADLRTSRDDRISRQALVRRSARGATPWSPLRKSRMAVPGNESRSQRRARAGDCV